MDRDDPLASARGLFADAASGALHFDANSVGPMPLSAADAATRILDEWRDLRRHGWTKSDWLDAPQRLGDKLGPLVGAAPGQLLVGDSTSINLHKALSLAVAAAGTGAVTIVSQHGTFPTDLYVAQGIVAARHDTRLLTVGEDETEIEAAVAAARGDSKVVLYLSHADYRSGRRLDMQRLCTAAAEAGALTVWDLSHSAGAGEIALDADGADFAAGCGYKYLCGGPGAPGWLYVAHRHQQVARPAPWGWMGHADTFSFEQTYRTSADVRAHRIGTPSVIAEAVFEAALDTWARVDLRAAWAKRATLAHVLIERLRKDHGLEVATPLESARQGGFVAVRHAQAARLCEGLEQANVVCSYRAPDSLRFGLSPLVHRYVDVWDACERVGRVMRSQRWIETR